MQYCKKVFKYSCIILTILSSLVSYANTSVNKVHTGGKEALCAQYGNTKVYTYQIVDYISKIYDRKFSEQEFNILPKEVKSETIK